MLNNVDVVTAAPPPQAKSYSYELTDYMITGARFDFRDISFEDVCRDMSEIFEGQEQSTTRTRLQKERDAYKSLFENFNGNLSTDRITHHGRRSKEDVIATMGNALRGTLLRRMPGLPSPGKWTRLSRPLDSFIFGLALNNLWLKLFSSAFRIADYLKRGGSVEGDDFDENSWILNTILYAILYTIL